MNNTTDRNREIGEAFGDKLAAEFQRLRLVSVTVDSVDEEFAYCKIYEDNEPLPVPLKTLNIADAILTVYPNAGSLAVVGLIDGSGTTPKLVSCVEIDKIVIKRGKTEFVWKITPPERDDEGNPVEGETEDEITLKLGDNTFSLNEDELNADVQGSTLRVAKDIIEFNGGTLDGLVIVGDLTARLNKLQGEIDQIQTAIAAHTHTYIDSKGSAATPTPSTTTATQYSKVTLTQVKDDDYINEKITQ